MPTLTLENWRHQEQALLNLLHEIETTCCTKSISTRYNIGSEEISEVAAISILAKKYTGLAEQLPEPPAAMVDEKTLAQYRARNIEVQQTLWRCSVVAGFKAIFDASDNEVQRLDNLLKQIAANTQHYLTKLPQTAAADKIIGNAVILNTLVTSAINIAADTAFGPIGPCIASFSLAIAEHVITYYLAAPKDSTKIMLRHLDPSRFIQLFQDCRGDTAQAFQALEDLNLKLSSAANQHWYNATQWGLASALGESIVRATADSASFLANTIRWTGRFFIPRYTAQTVTPPPLEDLIATTLSPARR